MNTDNTLSDRILEERYLHKDESGNIIETRDGMFRRVARAVAAAEDNYTKETSMWEEKFYRLMADGLFLPNSPTLFNSGRSPQMLSACFVLTVPDSLRGILEANTTAALIQKMGGGLGFNFSRLRGSGSKVKRTNGVASGPVSFMKAIHGFCQAIRQGGMRRGANLGLLSIEHPDIEDFITCKSEGGLDAFNLSVSITDQFIGRIKDGAKDTDAARIWDLIVESAWKTGDPGLLFIDEVNRFNPLLNEKIEGVNACGEQPLHNNASCNLGSINLANCLMETGDGRVVLDAELLGTTVRTAIRFLDDVLDVNEFPNEEIRKKSLDNRFVGLGVMGFADALYRMGKRYGCPSGADQAFATEVMKFVGHNAANESEKLGRERGSFPNIENSMYKCGGPRRNVTLTSIAPTGTISLLAGCSSGIEPNFGLVYKRKVDEVEYLITNPVFAEVAERNNYWDWANEDEMKESIFNGGGTIKGYTFIPEDIREVFVVAHDLHYRQHIDIQAAFQQYTCSGVSKTINLPSSASKEDVAAAYMYAYEKHCKGVTVFRDGCKGEQVLSTVHTTEPVQELFAPDLYPRTRPKTIQGTTTKYKVACGKLYITVNTDSNGPCEVFTVVGKAGGCPAQSEATSRLISLGLRSAIPADEIIEQLRGIRCLSCVRAKTDVLSCPDALARALENFDIGTMWANSEQEPRFDDHDFVYDYTINTVLRCPECGLEVASEGGCLVCHGCGWSKCG